MALAGLGDQNCLHIMAQDSKEAKRAKDVHSSTLTGFQWIHCGNLCRNPPQQSFDIGACGFYFTNHLLASQYFGIPSVLYKGREGGGHVTATRDCHFFYFF